MKFTITLDRGRKKHPGDVILETPFWIIGDSDAMMSLSKQISAVVTNPNGVSFLQIQGDETERERLKAQRAREDDDWILARAEEIKRARIAGGT